MKKEHVAGLAGVALLICLFGVWFWSLGAIASEDVPYMRLDAVQGKVEWKRETDANWVPLEQSVDVRVGDAIRTSADGKAEIRWGDRGVTRIDSNSQVTIEDVPKRDIPATGMLIKLRVSTGRAWSRMLKLLDVQSNMQVEGGGIVATVRGTAFGVATHATTTEIAVTDSVVRVSPIKGEAGIFVREGRIGFFSSTGTVAELRDTKESDTWSIENKRQDERFDQDLQEEITQRFKNRIPSAPEFLIDWSERLHVATAKDESRLSLVASYVGRRIAAVSLHPTELWRQTTLLEKASVLPEDRRGTLVVDVLHGLFLNHSSITVLQQLRTQLLSPQRQPFSDAITIDDAIDAGFARGLSESERQRLIQDVSDWFEPLQSRKDILPEELVLLRQKALAMDDRLAAPLMPVPTALVEPTTSSTQNTIPSYNRVTISPFATTTIGAPVSTSTGGGSAPQPCAYRALDLFAKPNQNVYVGDQVSLTSYVLCADGRVVDVTAQTGFQLTSATQGRLSGNQFVPSAAGSINITGTYTDPTGVKTKMITLNILKAIRVPRSVSVKTSGLTSLMTGQNAPLSAYASYSDGTSAEVTYQCVWSTTDPRVGQVFNAYFSALTATAGMTDVVCAYTDAGVTVRGSLTFTVKPELVPQTSAPAPLNPNRIF